MKAEELMIGDWVQDDEPDADGIITRCKVEAEDFMNEAFMNHTVPVPITPQILKDNGFDDDGKLITNKLGICYKQGLLGIFYIIHLEDEMHTLMFNDYDHKLTLGNIDYIHQLQHALRLCGVDKEIILNIEIQAK